MTPETLRRIEKLSSQAMEYASLAALASKSYGEGVDLFAAAAIKHDEVEMENARLAVHSAVDALLDNRFLIQKCSDEQKALINKF